MPQPKSPEAFRTISEVASDLDLPQHVLRFWETRFTQIKPMKRGGGRRYYRPEDVNLLRGIRALLYGEGYTIRGVQRLLKEKGPAFVGMVGQNGSVELAAAPPEEEEAAPIVLSEKTPPRKDVVPRAAERTPPPMKLVEASKPEAGIHQAPAPVSSSALPIAARRKMESVLADLAEAKRLLDQAR